MVIERIIKIDTKNIHIKNLIRKVLIIFDKILILFNDLQIHNILNLLNSYLFYRVHKIYKQKVDTCKHQ